MGKVVLEKKSWEAGYDAGCRRDSSNPPEGVEVLSWSSGYIEGKAIKKTDNRLGGSPATQPQDDTKYGRTEN